MSANAERVSGGERDKMALGERVRLARRMLRRASLGPVLVRVLLFVLAAAMLALAAPSSKLLGPGLALVVAGPVLVALMPRGRMVGLALLVAMAAWLVGTIVYDDRIVAWRLVALAATMYLTHNVAALAAVLPYDSVIPPGVLASWLVRAASVVGVSGAIGVFSLVEARWLMGPTYVAATVVGVAAVGVLVWFLTRPVRR